MEVRNRNNQRAVSTVSDHLTNNNDRERFLERKGVVTGEKGDWEVKPSTSADSMKGDLPADGIVAGGGRWPPAIVGERE